MTDQTERKFRAQFETKYCVICGERSTGISGIGVSTCGRHVNSPANQARYDGRTGELVTDEYLTIPHFMWIWKVGAKPGSACAVCGERTTRCLSRSGERVGRFCAEHAPDRPFYDPSACVDCGRSSGWLDFDCKNRCDVHHQPMPGAGCICSLCGEPMEDAAQWHDRSSCYRSAETAT